jgi:hypothetical protein
MRMRMARQLLDHYVGRDDLTPGQRDYERERETTE